MRKRKKRKKLQTTSGVGSTVKAPKKAHTITSSGTKIRAPIKEEQTMRGVDRARLDKYRTELQRDYQKFRRYLRDKGQLDAIAGLTGQLDKKSLYEMEVAGASYQDIKNIYENIRDQLRSVGQVVQEIKRDVKEGYVRETPIHKPGSSAISALEAAELESTPLKNRIPRSLDSQLDAVVGRINSMLDKYRNSSPDAEYAFPPNYDPEKIKKTLTDASSYKREIERLTKAYLDNPDWRKLEGTFGGGVMLSGERAYLQSIIEEENKRRAEARQLLDLQEQRGFLTTEPEFATRAIDTTTYDRDRMRRTADVYNDAALDRRAQIWKENMLRSLKGIHDAVVNKGFVTNKDEAELEAYYKDLVKIISALSTTEDIRKASLYGPEIQIYQGDYKNIPDAIGHLVKMYIGYQKLFGNELLDRVDI